MKERTVNGDLQMRAKLTLSTTGKCNSGHGRVHYAHQARIQDFSGEGDQLFFFLLPKI